MPITAPELRADLRSLEIEPGDELVVHSSLSSIGLVAGGAATVVDALVSAVGDRGTIAVPTFTPRTTRQDPFEVAETPSETGAVTEALRERDDAVRSDHPTHSVAAVGPAAEALTADHDYRNSLGEDSPLHRLAKRGGKVFLLGVGHDSNSTLHLAEALADLPYKNGTNRPLVTDGTGEPRTVETATVGCGKGFARFRPAAERAGIVVRGRVGAAGAQLMLGADVLRVARSVLEDDPGSLLCEEADCWWRPGARCALEEG